jgi:hypothetical protein
MEHIVTVSNASIPAKNDCHYIYKTIYRQYTYYIMLLHHFKNMILWHVCQAQRLTFSALSYNLIQPKSKIFSIFKTSFQSKNKRLKRIFDQQLRKIWNSDFTPERGFLPSKTLHFFQRFVSRKRVWQWSKSDLQLYNIGCNFNSRNRGSMKMRLLRDYKICLKIITGTGFQISSEEFSSQKV